MSGYETPDYSADDSEDGSRNTTPRGGLGASKVHSVLSNLKNNNGTTTEPQPLKAVLYSEKSPGFFGKYRGYNIGILLSTIGFCTGIGLFVTGVLKLSTSIGLAFTIAGAALAVVCFALILTCAIARSKRARQDNETNKLLMQNYSTIPARVTALKNG